MMRTVMVMGGVSLCALVSALGCGTSSSARARLELQNNTGASSLLAKAAGGLALQSIAPTSTSQFSAKMASVYLVEDVDPATSNNVGTIAMLWVSPHCTGC